MVNFREPQKIIFFTFRHDFATKYLTATQAPIGRIFTLFSMWTAYVVQSLDLSREYFEIRINTMIFGQVEGATEILFYS